jgi:fructose-1,6-bisphosphatase/inositol monophosphatase family enzyme
MTDKAPDKRTHNSELWLLTLIASGMILLLLAVAILKRDWDVAACLLVLQSIIGVIRDRPRERTTERMTDQLAGSTPAVEDQKK